ncbi:MAG: zinc-ribbon domain-containing protein [Candidatus Bipolaricaulia bacterium]
MSCCGGCHGHDSEHGHRHRHGQHGHEEKHEKRGATITCTNCGSVVNESFVFCPHCGTAIQGSSAPTRTQTI